MSVGKNIPHDSSSSHVTGESIFIDDRPLLSNELFVGILGSPMAYGKITNIDFTKALSLPGVVQGFTHKDLNSNTWGAIVKEQPILAFDQVMYKGEPIAIIACENPEIINKALDLIEVSFQEEKGNLTIEEGMDAKDFIYKATSFKQGDFENSYKNSPYKLEDVFECGGQEHFYLENQASIAYPMEQGQIEIHSSSQHPTETQHVVEKALGLSYHQVVCQVKRMGGAFGGKESQASPIACMAALVAQKLNRPARLILSKDQDMEITGRRHPFKNFYKVGFDNTGKILALWADLYANAGSYADLTSSILERAMFHLDGAYYLENVTIHGTAVRTHNPSNTAFRGFGGPQGNMTIEVAIEKIAQVLGKDALEIRRLNCYGQGSQNITPYGQTIGHNPLPELFKKIKMDSNYFERRKKINEFNEKSKVKVRGLSLTATKFGIAFTA